MPKIDSFTLAPVPDFIYQKVAVFTDGACSGNPGPGGWGAVLRFEEREIEIYGADADTTNNRMELTAAMRALQYLQRPSEIELTTDSRILQQGITEWMPKWKQRNWRASNRKAVKNIDLWKAIDRLNQWHRVHWKWVKGHSGHPENERADRLANRGVDELLGRRGLDLLSDDAKSKAIKIS